HPLPASCVAVTDTPVRAVKRQLASNDAPAGRGSGAHTRKSNESKWLGTMSACVDRFGALVMICACSAVVMAVGKGSVPLAVKRPVLDSAVARCGSRLNKSEDR